MSVYLLVDVSYLYNIVKTQICYEFPYIHENFKKRNHMYNVYQDRTVVYRTIELFMSYLQHFVTENKIELKNIVMFRDGNHSKCWKREYNKTFKEGKSAFTSPELQTGPTDQDLNNMFGHLKDIQERKDQEEDYINFFERKNKRNLAFIHDYFDLFTLLMYYLGDNYIVLNQRLDAEADEQIFMFTENILQKSYLNTVIILSGDTDFLQLITPCNKLDTLLYSMGIHKMKTSYLKWEQYRNRISVIDPSIWYNRVRINKNEIVLETSEIYGVDLRTKYNESLEKLSLYLTYKIICGKPADGLPSCATQDQIQYIYGKQVSHPMMTFPSSFKIKELLTNDKDFKERFINNLVISYYKYTPQKIRDMIQPCLVEFEKKQQRETVIEGVFNKQCHVQISVHSRFLKFPSAESIGFTVYHWLNQKNSEYIVNMLSKRVGKLLYRSLRDLTELTNKILKSELSDFCNIFSYEINRAQYDMIIDWIQIKWYRQESYMLHYIYPDPTESVTEMIEEYSKEYPDFSNHFYKTVDKCKDFIYTLIQPTTRDGSDQSPSMSRPECTLQVK